MTAIANAPPDRSRETTEAGVPWLAFHQHRRTFRERWRSIWELPVVRSPLAGVTVGPEHVLDVGATTRVWEEPVRRRWPDVDYRSLDIDRTAAHDYYAFDDLERTFDLVLCLEVLEHVPAAQAIDLLERCRDACRPGGDVVVSVPNVLTPGTQLEFTHRTAYACMDLHGLLGWVGLEVTGAARLWLRDSRSLFIHRRLLGPLHRALKVDYCQSIVMTARRPEGS